MAKLSTEQRKENVMGVWALHRRKIITFIVAAVLAAGGYSASYSPLVVNLICGIVECDAPAE